MSPARIEKIGSQSLLDKQWANQPLGVIKNPHKLSEIELYKALEKIVDLPEKRLKAMLKQGGNAVDEVFMANIMMRIPQFLTVTLVNLTKTLILQKDFFKDHPIWKPLEQELFRRRKNLNNEQLATVIHSFGITGNGSIQFYQEMEEIIVDTPIPIETEYLEKILTGYSQIDQGSPVFYSDMMERIIHRGLENIEILKLTEIARNLSKATNVHKAGYGFYHKLEKYIHKSLHEGKLGFKELSQIVQNLLPANIGSNQFHNELEQFLLEKYTTENLQDIVNLVKGLQQYKIKLEALDFLIYKTIEKYIDEFTLKQIETLLWSISKSLQNLQQEQIIFEQLQQNHKSAIQALIDKAKQKSPSMRARSVAFTIESIANLNYKSEETFRRFEKVVFSKIEEFIPHYIVKVMSSFYKIGYGSGELYDKLIQKALSSISVQSMQYADMIRFFEVFPEVSYIYDNTMSQEYYTQFTKKIQQVMKDKKFPTEDICKVFNILVRISAFKSPELSQSKDNFMFMNELIGRLRHSIYDIPKDYFALTLVNLLEFMQPEIASKFIFIIKEVQKQKLLSQEFNQKDLIKIFWSLFQLEQALKDLELVSKENLSFLNDIDLEELDSRHFLLYKQLVSLVKMWELSLSNKDEIINYDKIYENIQKLSQDKREEFINEDPATKSHQGTIQEILSILKKENLFKEVKQNISDDLINLIHIGCTKGTLANPILYGIIIMNNHCYIQGIQESEPIVRRSIELKHQILSDLFGWNLILIDEDDFRKQSDKKSYVLERLQLELSNNNIEDSAQQQFEKGGRKVKKKQSKIIQS